MNEERSSKKKLIANIIFFLIVIIVLGVIIFNINDINEIINHTKTAKIGYLIIAVVLVLIHMTLTNLSLYAIQSKVENSLPFWPTMHIANTEHLFNAITPFSSGGQPIQAYYLIKNGLSGDESMSVLVVNFIVYQFILTIFSTIGLIIYFSRIYETISQYAFIIVVGFVINTIILVGLILVATVDGFKRLLRGFLRLLGKIKFLNKPMTKLEEKTFTFVERFQKGAKYLLYNKKVLFDIILLRVIDLIVFYSIPVFIFSALHVEVADVWFVIFMTAFSCTFMLWVPTPGASGGVEWAFTMLFVGVIANSSVVVTTMLFWRGITYFLPLILGFFSYLIIRRRGETVCE